MRWRGWRIAIRRSTSRSAGRGDLDGRARRAGARAWRRERVHLLGLRADVAAVLAAADLFVLPSLSEGLPLALLEAMFAGRADRRDDAVGEVRAALDHGRAGVLVPPGDAPALAAALDGLLSADPARAHCTGAWRASAPRPNTTSPTWSGNTDPYDDEASRRRENAGHGAGRGSRAES